MRQNVAPLAPLDEFDPGLGPASLKIAVRADSTEEPSCERFAKALPLHITQSKSMSAPWACGTRAR